MDSNPALWSVDPAVFAAVALPTVTVQRAALLNDRNDHPVTVLWALAGSGKTTLLGQWAKQHAAEGDAVAWLNAAKIGVASPPLSTLVEYAIAAAEAEAIAGGQSPAVIAIMLDDVHLLDREEDRAWLSAAITAPSALHRWYLAGRFAPGDLDLRCRLAGAREYRSEELAFTQDEISTFFSARGTVLTDDSVVIAHERSGGWAIALTLISGLLIGEDSPDAVVAKFSADDRATGDYLVTQLLDKLSASALDFLLSTSVVDDMNAALAFALSGREDAGELLRRMERESIVTSRPSGDTGSDETVFQYHPLLLRYLRTNLGASSRPRLSALHATASRWYGAHGAADASLRHAIATEDHDLLAEVVTSEGMGVIFQGRGQLVREALDVLELEQAETPGTHVIAALLGAPYFSDEVAARYHLSAATPTLLTPALRALSEALASMLIGDHAPDERAPLDTHDGGALDLGTLTFLALSSGVALQRRERHGEACAVFRAAALSARKGRRLWLYQLCLELGADSEASTGNWREADELLDRMAEVSRQAGVPTDQVSARSRFAAAAQKFARCDPDALLNRSLPAPVLELDSGLDFSWSVLQLLDRLDVEANQRPHLDTLDTLLRCRGRLHPRVLAWAAFRYIDSIVTLRGPAQAKQAVTWITEALGHDSLDAQLLRAQVSTGSSRQRSEEDLLAEALDRGDRAWHASTPVLAALLLAQWADASDRKPTADRWIARSLELAHPLRNRRPFLAAQGMGAHLLESRAGRLQPYEDFATEVIAARRSVVPAASDPDVTFVFTPKEHEILRELPRHQSVGDIARNHQLSPNTVKTHLRSIYQKLGVNARTEAVEMAVHYGLI